MSSKSLLYRVRPGPKRSKVLTQNTYRQEWVTGLSVFYQEYREQTSGHQEFTSNKPGQLRSSQPATPRHFDWPGGT